MVMLTPENTPEPLNWLALYETFLLLKTLMTVLAGYGVNPGIKVGFGVDL